MVSMLGRKREKNKTERERDNEKCWGVPVGEGQGILSKKGEKENDAL